MVVPAATFFVVPPLLLDSLCVGLLDRQQIVSRLRPIVESQTDFLAEDMEAGFLVSKKQLKAARFGRRSVVGSHTAVTLAAR